MMISLFTIVIQLFFCFSVFSQTASSNRFKRIDYEYDLVSGKVNKVSYQKDSADQFIHQYSYDSDNRITKVETSSDNVVWDVDAKYFYYAHGPLARTEIGNDKVQGIDYAYTLQGWIKGVNSNTLDKKRDMGQDGKDTSIYDPSNPQLHANFAQDAFGYSLNYFKGDYKAISQVRWSNTTNRFEAVTSGSDLMASRHDLHNGNISSMITTIVKPTITPGDTMQFVPLPQGTAYKYDQLNRLVEMKAWQNLNSVNNTWGTGLTYNGMYNNKFSYDANGNILTALAKNQSGQTIDDQTYHQQTLAGKKVRNRTYSITDLATLTSGNDLLNQTPFDNNDATINTNNNYSFTEIGERKSDKQDSIDLITWTVYGKIKEVKRTPGCAKMNVKFRYDPQGNTISKHFYKSDDTTWISSEYYIRDAQGNLLTVYKKQIISSSLSYSKTEHHIYGSGLIGIDRTEKQLIGSSFLLNQPASNHLIGNKDYTGNNHLGNVLVTFTDKKLPIDVDNDNVIDYYLPEVVTANDYAPFGSLLTERTYNKGDYPNSFNGKRDSEGLNFQDYGARIYNQMERIFPSVDPLFKSYPWNSSYAFAENTPIGFIDLDGREKYHYAKTIENGETVFKLIGVENLVETTYSIEWNGWMPKIVYTTHTNERKEFITHQESEGTVENFDKVQFITIDETITYSSVDNMVNNIDGDSGNEKMWHYAAKGLQNIHEEKMMAGNGGGGLNWSKAFKKFGIGDYIPNAKKFMESANKIVDKSGLTKIGRDLQSHIMRSSGSAFKNIKWSGKSGNSDALKILDNIMSSKNQIIKTAKRGGYEVYDEVSGQGFGISRNGEFNGFRELTKKK